MGVAKQVMDHYETQIRVDSCLGVIRDIHTRLLREDINPRIVEQLQHLNDMLSLIDHKSVTETEMTRIEGCCNQLLTELGVLFTHRGIDNLYEITVH